MKKSVYEWIRPQVTAESLQKVQSYLEEHQLPTFLAPILVNRDIISANQLDAFFHSDLSKLHDLFLLHDMEKGVKRIQSAIEKGEKILIYGDYDCDGVTGTSVMKETLENIGAEPEVYIPNRFVDGYGPNLDAFKYFVDQGIQLIITVDNGISGHEAIQYATDHQVDVIVTDHHEMKETLPDAYALIHPRLGDTYPFPDLAGVGVAFKLACALLGEVPVELLDLVAIGTIGDLVPLKDENRILVQQGLKVLQQTDRIGLRALAEVADIDLTKANEETIGFAIGPRINALGRLGEARPAVDLLTTFDDEEAMRIAEEINTKNQERQAIVNQITEEALAMVNDDDIQVLAKEGWNEGVLGIVASRIVEQTGKPAFVLAINSEEGTAKGSGRSIGDANLFQLLQQVDRDLMRYGGHHMAAGLTLKLDCLDAFRQDINQVAQTEHLSFRNELLVDEELTEEMVSIEQIEALQSLAPFGTGNPIPRFLLQPKSVDNLRRIGAERHHIKGTMQVGETELPFVSFQFKDSKRELISSPEIQCVGELGINEWNGKRTPQFRLKDYAVDGIQLFDGRAQRFMEEDFIDSNAVVVCFQPKHCQKIQSKMVPHSVITAEEYLESELSFTQVILFDVPCSLDELTQLIQSNRTTRYVIVFHSFEEVYLNGMPNREQFARLFRFIAQNKQVDVRYKLQQVSQFVKIPVHVLTFMIKVFAELGFVKIDNGVMYTVENPAKHPLESSHLFQQRQSLIKIEEFLIYSDIETLEKWFQQQEEII